MFGLSDHAVPIVMKTLIWKEAKIVTSRVSHGEFGLTLAALEAGHLQPEALISDVVPASQVQQAFDTLVQDPQKHLKVLLDFTDADALTKSSP